MGSPAIVTEFRFDSEITVGVFRATPNGNGTFTVDIEESNVDFTTADLLMASEFFRRLAEASKEKNDGK